MRKIDNPLLTILCSLTLALTNSALLAADLSIAVSGDFDFTLEELKTQFEQTNNHTVTIIPGTSSFHYAQILDGTGYDIFLSDENARPKVLEENGITVSGSRFIYAKPRLVLWSIDKRSLSSRVLQENEFQLLAITNPRLSPFGLAAREFLQAIDTWDAIQKKIVMGENVGQTYQFAISGDVDIALIAFPQIIYGNYMQAGSYWLIPEHYYTAIEQHGVLLADKDAAWEFLSFMKSETGQDIIRSNGFLP